jgi:hypothetical protein
MIEMGYYMIRAEEEFLVEAPNHFIRIYCDIRGNIKIQKSKKGKGVVLK